MAIFASNLAPASTDRALGGAEMERSFRFNDNDSAYLQRQPSSNTSGSSQKITISFWIKLGNIPSGTNGGTFFGTSGDNHRGQFFNQEFYFGNANYWINTTAVVRDSSSWYHVVYVVDTTQGTTSNRQKIYVNGVLQDRGDTISDPSQNATFDYFNNSSQTYYIGRRQSGNYFDGYLAEIHFIDGYAYDASYFGYTEQQTGIWRHKKVTGITYGTNGFYLDFSDNSSITNICLDKSGNANNFSPDNCNTEDSMLDTPTNNFPTLNPLDKASTVSLKNGNLQIDNVTNQNYDGVRANFGTKTGKYYWEIKFPTTGYLSAIGIARADGRIDTANQPTYRIVLGLGSWYNTYNSGGVATYVNATPSGDYPSVATWSGASNYSNNDIYMIAVDFDTGKIWWGKNNSWFNNSGTANPATGTDPRITFTTGNEWFPYSQEGDSSTSPQAYNFGQQGFAYTPPSGFVALSSKNIPPKNVPSIIRPKRHFDILLYTGNGATQSITGLEFAPDFVWIKERSSTSNHTLGDTVRGANKILESNDSDAEAEPDAGAHRFKSFDPNGFTHENSGAVNQSSQTYVAWCWKAGGSSTVTNNDGNNTSQVSVNTEAGFSILTYTGNGTNNSNITMGHGLGKKPGWVIIKNRDSAADWVVWVTGVGGSADDNQKNLGLNVTSAAGQNSSQFRYADSSIIAVRDTDSNGNVKVNKSGDKYVSYCWAEVPGFSKFGSYTGNGSSDGPYIHLGFRPAFIMLKRYDTTNNWHIADSKRQNSYNPVTAQIYPNLSSAEVSQVDLDILSNGFKFRNSAAFGNASGGTYVYMAFAEEPGTTPFDTFPNAR